MVEEESRVSVTPPATPSVPVTPLNGFAQLMAQSASHFLQKKSNPALIFTTPFPPLTGIDFSWMRKSPKTSSQTVSVAVQQVNNTSPNPVSETRDSSNVVQTAPNPSSAQEVQVEVPDSIQEDVQVRKV